MQRIHDLRQNGIRNLVLVGKARRSDLMPGPSVVEALDLVSLMNLGYRGAEMEMLPGGICIFNRDRKTDHGYETQSEELNEYQRVAIKARHGCRFVTGQISFDSRAPIDFFTGYKAHCEKSGERPISVFVSLSTIKSEGILSLFTERLEVYVPEETTKKLLRDLDRMGELSLEISPEVFSEIVESIKSNRIDVPVGLHIEQVGKNSADLSLELLDRTYPILKSL